VYLLDGERVLLGAQREDDELTRMVGIWHDVAAPKAPPSGAADKFH
jgi:hypothetical protein